jgi:hypothetical protein
MGILLKRSTANDDLNAGQDPQSLEHRKGYMGDGGFNINGNLTQGASPDYSPDGEGYAVVNGYKQAGTSAYDADVNRDRADGTAAQSRTAVQLNQGAANGSRGMQMDALGMMGTAAHGAAPSRAAALGQTSTDNTIRAASAGMGGARGPGASIAAMNGAQVGAANKMGANNAAITDMRAAEMAKAQGEYAMGAQGVEGQDIGAATANAKLEAQQRALNEARQQADEQRGFGVRKSQSQNADDWSRQQQAQADAIARSQQAQSAADDATQQHDISMVEGWLMGAAGSDERMKRNIRPLTMGGLGLLTRKAPK